MQTTFNTLEFKKIIDMLEEYAYTKQAKEKIRELKPYLAEAEVHSNLRETTEARTIIDGVGDPPLVSMESVDTILKEAEQGAMLSPEQLEYTASVLTGVKRLKSFLERSKYLEVGLAYDGDALDSLEDVREEISQKIRNGYIDDHATNALRDLRRKVLNLKEKIKAKAEGLLKSNKECYSDHFISNRNGHICLPVKKEYKFKVSGSVIDKSSTGATLFIEPTVVAKLNEELQLLQMDVDNEERRILYILSDMVGSVSSVFSHNLCVIIKLDFAFAKGKMSAAMKGIKPSINTKRYISIKKAKHPLLEKDTCVPLDFEVGNKAKGIVITGPNTGGKTVAIKTVGLLSLMAQSGLHVPCESIDICMNSQVLCDIGDGQNITENLSTFSAHITNILWILERANEESLIILDELGSGTDPAEGMGIAIAILAQLKKIKCLFVATTHYPEVKHFAEKTEDIVNARMAFDRETLQPLYRLEIGKAGESCALHIAKRLGMSAGMIKQAFVEAYGEKEWKEQHNFPEVSETEVRKNQGPRIQKREVRKSIKKEIQSFQMGDSVLINPERTIGIVCKKANNSGEVLVQVKKEKILVNHKRLTLQVAASQLYPEDYDFSIIFDTVANRKARHQMNKRHISETLIEVEE